MFNINCSDFTLKVLDDVITFYINYIYKLLSTLNGEYNIFIFILSWSNKPNNIDIINSTYCKSIMIKY